MHLWVFSIKYIPLIVLEQPVVLEQPAVHTVWEGSFNISPQGSGAAGVLTSTESIPNTHRVDQSALGLSTPA